MAIPEALIRLGVKNKASKEITQVRGQISGLSEVATKAKYALGALFAGFSFNAIKSTIVEFESLEASLRTVTGSVDNAKIAFDGLKRFAADTPFQLQELTQAYIKLASLGLEPSEDAIKSFGNTASAMGKSLNQMIEAVADATTMEFERLKEFGIKAKQEADTVTFIFQGVSTTVKKEAGAIEGYLRDIGNVQFAGAMERQMETLGGAISNFEDSVSLLMESLGKAGLSNAFKEAASWASQFAKDLKSVTDGVGEAETAIEGLRNVFGLWAFGTGSMEEQLGKLLTKQEQLEIREKALLEQSREFPATLTTNMEHLKRLRAEYVANREEIERLQKALGFGDENRSGDETTNNPAEGASDVKEEYDALAESIRAVGDSVEELKEAETIYWTEHSQGIETAEEQWRSLENNVVDLRDEIAKSEEELEKSKETFKEFGLIMTSSLEDAITNFESLGDVVNSLFEDIQKMIIRKTITNPISDFISGFDFTSLFSFADGGIMTAGGPVPLRKYAQGGIANSPQLAMFGEGSTPEAYVPVPSGRIPVELRGGGNNIQVNIVNETGNAVKTEQRSDSNGTQVIDVMVMNSIDKLSKSGGLDKLFAGYGQRRKPVGR